MAETIKFGPQWIRMLSDGGTGGSNGASDCSGNVERNTSTEMDNSNNSSNTSAQPPKTYSQPQYQYSREDVLALYPANSEMPSGIDSELQYICIAKTLHPVSFGGLSEDEMRLMNQTVNSNAVLRKQTPNPPIVRSPSERGARGRPRGSDGFYRDDESGYSRSRHSQNWYEDSNNRSYNSRNGNYSNRQYDSHDSDTSGISHSFQRSTSNSDTWRNNDDDPSGNSNDGWKRMASKNENNRWRGKKLTWRGRSQVSSLKTSPSVRCESEFTPNTIDSHPFAGSQQSTSWRDGGGANGTGGATSNNSAGSTYRQNSYNNHHHDSSPGYHGNYSRSSSGYRHSESVPEWSISEPQTDSLGGVGSTGQERDSALSTGTFDSSGVFVKRRLDTTTTRTPRKLSLKLDADGEHIISDITDEVEDDDVKLDDSRSPSSASGGGAGVGNRVPKTPTNRAASTPGKARNQGKQPPSASLAVPDSSAPETRKSPPAPITSKSPNKTPNKSNGGKAVNSAKSTTTPTQNLKSSASSSPATSNTSNVNISSKPPIAPPVMELSQTKSTPKKEKNKKQVNTVTSGSTPPFAVVGKECDNATCKEGAGDALSGNKNFNQKSFTSSSTPQKKIENAWIKKPDLSSQFKEEVVSDIQENVSILPEADPAGASYHFGTDLSRPTPSAMDSMQSKLNDIIITDKIKGAMELEAQNQAMQAHLVQMKTNEEKLLEKNALDNMENNTKNIMDWFELPTDDVVLPNQEDIPVYPAPNGQVLHSNETKLLQFFSNPISPQDLWTYVDPNELEQGPFTNAEMEDWFNAGYFKHSLNVKRTIDLHYNDLGLIVRKLGHLPFDKAYMYTNQTPESNTPMCGVNGGVGTTGGGLLQQMHPINLHQHIQNPHSSVHVHHQGPIQPSSSANNLGPHLTSQQATLAHNQQYGQHSSYPSQHVLPNEFSHHGHYSNNLSDQMNYAHPNQHAHQHLYDHQIIDPNQPMQKVHNGRSFAANIQEDMDVSATIHAANLANYGTSSDQIHQELANQLVSEGASLANAPGNAQPGLSEDDKSQPEDLMAKQPIWENSSQSTVPVKNCWNVPLKQAQVPSFKKSLEVDYNERMQMENEKVKAVVAALKSQNEIKAVTQELEQVKLEKEKLEDQQELFCNKGQKLMKHLQDNDEDSLNLKTKVEQDKHVAKMEQEKLKLKAAHDKEEKIRQNEAKENLKQKAKADKDDKHRLKVKADEEERIRLARVAKQAEKEKKENEKLMAAEDARIKMEMKQEKEAIRKKMLEEKRLKLERQLEASKQAEQQQKLLQQKLDAERIEAEREVERRRQEATKKQPKLDDLKLPTSAGWANKPTKISVGESLSSIQKIQIDKQVKLEKAEIENQKRIKDAHAKEQRSNAGKSWSSRLTWLNNDLNSVQPGKAKAPTLVDIQNEQEKQQVPQKHSVASLIKSSPAASRQPKVTTTPVSAVAAPKPLVNNKTWTPLQQVSTSQPSNKAASKPSKPSVRPLMDDCAWETLPKEMPFIMQKTKKSRKQNKALGNQNVSSSKQAVAKPIPAPIAIKTATPTAKQLRKEQELLKLVEAKDRAEFLVWIEKNIKGLKHPAAADVDVPTFAGFIVDVESPFEVRDYVKGYIGDNPIAAQFAEDFIAVRSAKRSKATEPSTSPNSLQRSNDDPLAATMSNGASPTTSTKPPTSPQETIQNEFVFVSSKGGKKNKKKMQKLDNSILGFTVHAAPDRLNAGEIDYN